MVGFVYVFFLFLTGEAETECELVLFWTFSAILRPVCFSFLNVFFPYFWGFCFNAASDFVQLLQSVSQPSLVPFAFG